MVAAGSWWREGLTHYYRSLESGGLFVLQVPRSRGLDKGRGQPQQRRNLELKPIRREQNSE